MLDFTRPVINISVFDLDSIPMALTIGDLHVQDLYMWFSYNIVK